MIFMISPMLAEPGFLNNFFKTLLMSFCYFLERIGPSIVWLADLPDCIHDLPMAGKFVKKICIPVTIRKLDSSTFEPPLCPCPIRPFFPFKFL
jgi:hypothetical protein